MLSEANKLFRPLETGKATTDYDKAQQSFHENRERLKAERVAREVKSKTRSNRLSSQGQALVHAAGAKLE
jgi:hypothetical protein